MQVTNIVLLVKDWAEGGLPTARRANEDDLHTTFDLWQGPVLGAAPFYFNYFGEKQTDEKVHDSHVHKSFEPLTGHHY